MCVVHTLHAEVLHDALSVNELLGDETGGGEHGEAAVLKLRSGEREGERKRRWVLELLLSRISFNVSTSHLLGLHLLELLRILRAEAEGVKVDVPRDVVGAEGELVLALEVGGGHPSNLSAVDLRDSNGEDEDLPEGLGNLGEVVDGRSRNLGVEKEGGTLDLLTDEEANEGKHGNATVGQLGLTETADLVVIGTLKEVEGVCKGREQRGVRKGWVNVAYYRQ